MLETGRPQEEILAELEKRLKGDMNYQDGHILGSMCTFPHEFATRVYTKYLEKNLGDRGLFPATGEIEDELVRQVGDLFGDPDIVGSIVSGGSEANIVAMRLMRRVHADIKHPEIFLSESAHVSFDKSAELMGITVHRVPLLDDYLPDMNYLRDHLSSDAIGVVGIAGTTSLGLVEPIEEMAEIASDHDLFVHVDAAYGGFVLPFLPLPVPKWDFRVPGVYSITADPHKQGMNLIPSGGIFVRDPSCLREHSYNIPYLAGGDCPHLSLVGTRPGAVVLSFWALMQHLGRAGYREIIQECMDNARYLAHRVDEIPRLQCAADLVMNVVGIVSTDPTLSMKTVEMAVRKRGWALAHFPQHDLARVVCMPHIKRPHLEEFCDVLEEVTKQL